MPGVRAGVLGPTELDGLPVSPSEVILPCLSVLPMGWTWVLRFCQAVTEQCVREEVGDHALVQDRRPGIVKGPLVLAGAAYVDNFGICGTNPTEVDRALDRVSTRLFDLGFTVHELETASTCTAFIGLETSDGLIRVKRARLWKLRRAIECVLSRDCCSGALLEVLLGHATWLMLLRRESLSILHACYHFIQTCYHRPTLLHCCGAVCARSFRRWVHYCHC